MSPVFGYTWQRVWLKGELEEAQTLAMKILGIHNLPKEYLFLRSRAHRLCGKIYARKGSYENSVLCLQKSLVLARNLELSSEAEQAQSALAYQHFWAGFVTEAKTDFTDLWASAQERQDMPLIIRYTYMLGEIARAQNKPQLAEQFFRKSISIAKPAGNRLAVANGLAAISLVKSNKDALDALTICGQSLQIFKDLNNPKELAQAELIKARIEMLLNETSKAEKTIEHIIEIAKSIKDQPLELEAWLRLILMYARANQTETVLSLWPKVSHLATHIDNHRLQLSNYTLKLNALFHKTSS